MAANPFDRFDAPGTGNSNPFDRFDGRPAGNAAKAAPAAAKPSYGATDEAASNFTFGLSDKVGAGGTALGGYLRSLIATGHGDARSLSDLVLGRDKSLSGRYSDALQAQNAAKSDYEAANPNATRALSALGILAGSPASTALSAVRAGVVAGTVAGAAGAAGQSHGDVVDQAGQIALGAGLGAATGGVLAKVVPGSIHAVGNFRNRLAARAGMTGAPVVASSTEGKAQAVIGRALAADGGADAAGQLIADAADRGVPLSLADTGDNARGLAAKVSRAPGESRTIMRDAVVSRQEGQTERVQGAITRNLGPTANVRNASDALIADARSKAGPLYDAAYAQPAVSSPTLEKLLATPAGGQAIARARTIAANEMRDPAAMGFALDGQGNTVLNPIPVDRIADQKAAQEAHDDAAAAVKKALARSQQGDPNSGFMAAQSAFEDAAGKLNGANKALANTPAGGTTAATLGYTPQTLDYVKRGLDDVVESHRDPVTGKLILDEAGRAINGVRAQLNSHLRDVIPGYGDALNAYAGPAKMASALRKGSQLGRKSADDIAAETANLSAPELDHYKLGVRSALSQALEGQVDGADKARALVGTPKKRAVLNRLFGQDGGLDNFMATIADEGRTSATYGRINAGSSTSRDLADDGVDHGITDLARAGQHFFSGHPIKAAIDVGRHVYDKVQGEAGERLRSQLAVNLSETDPAVLAAALRTARAAAIAKAARDRASKPAAIGGAAFAGRGSGYVASLLGRDQ